MLKKQDRQSDHQSSTSPAPVVSPPSPDVLRNAAAAEIRMRGSYTDGRKKWTESKVHMLFIILIIAYGNLSVYRISVHLLNKTYRA